MNTRKIIDEFSYAAPRVVGILISLLTTLGLIFTLFVTGGSSAPSASSGTSSSPTSKRPPSPTPPPSATDSAIASDAQPSPETALPPNTTTPSANASPSEELPSVTSRPQTPMKPEPLLPVTAWAAPEPRMLNIPTHEGSGQGTHPSVLYFEDGWNGYKYWMAFTPYPKNSNFEEDPNIVVSNDGDHWEVPQGLTNPLDDAPGDKAGYNSDTNLAFHDGRLYLTWRRVTPQQTNEFYLMTSSDGVHWTDKKLIFNQGAVSQALVRVGDKWRFYAIQGLRAKENVLVYWESDLDVPTPESWSEKVICNMNPLGPVYEPWHVDVQKVGDEWYGLVADTEFDRNGVRGRVHFMRSSDGINWELSQTPLFPTSGKNYNAHYKSGFVASGTGNNLKLDVFAAFLDTNSRDWHIGRTTASALKDN